MQMWRKKSIRKMIIFLMLCSLLPGCGNAQETKTTVQQESTEQNEASKEVLGWNVTEGEVFTGEEQISYIPVNFTDYKVSAALPKVLWDPDNFYNMSKEGGGTDALDLPLTDWANEDMLCIVVPSTAFFSLTETEDSIGTEKIKDMSDAEFLEKKLEGYDNITVLSDQIQKKEKNGYYQTAIKVQVALTLYNSEFTFEGYWISVYHKGKVLDFSYGEVVTEDGEGYKTAETVLENFEFNIGREDENE